MNESEGIQNGFRQKNEMRLITSKVVNELSEKLMEISHC